MTKSLIRLAALALALAGGAVSTASAAGGPFKALVPPTEVFNLKSAAWKPFPEKPSFVFTHEGESYLVAGKRDDGTLMVIVRQPSSERPGEVFYVGSYLKCGVMADVSFFPSDAASLEQELAEPSADNTESRMGFDATMGMHDLYSLVCPQ
jgi:hypothetical protein